MEREFESIDKSAFDAIKCSHCNKLLNISPIYCIDNNLNIDQICGRCVHILDIYDKNQQRRQNVYEHLAKFITYPCSNKHLGCDVILHWNEVKEHENICPFYSMNCPLFYQNIFPGRSCAWTGNTKKLDEHITACHKDCILNPPQVDWTDSTTNTIFFTNVGAQLITVVIKYERDAKYYCLLMTNGSDVESQCFRYQLELFDEKKNNSIILRKNRLESIVDMLTNMANHDKMLEIDLTRLKEMIKTTSRISGRFGIVKKNKKEVIQITGVKDHELLANSTANGIDNLLSPDETMLQELECPVCNEHMIPPIYICETGHSICYDCKGKVQSCPNCRSPLSGARNFTLERLTTKVHYPCRNREIGCSFVTTSETIRGHERSCELSENPCILNCGWMGLRPNMINHLTEIHSASLIQANAVYVHDIRDKKEACYKILYVLGELFRFSIKGTGKDAYKFNVQHLGMAEYKPTFRYKLQITDDSPLGLNMSLTNVCQCLTKHANGAHARAITVPWEMLKPFIFDSRYFSYKIIINKM